MSNNNKKPISKLPTTNAKEKINKNKQSTHLQNTTTIPIYKSTRKLHEKKFKQHWGPKSPVIQSYGIQKSIYGRFLFHFVIWEIFNLNLKFYF